VLTALSSLLPFHLGTNVAALKLDSMWKWSDNELRVWELRIRWRWITCHRTLRRRWQRWQRRQRRYIVDSD
jgi:hypothetical protein